MEGVSGRGEQPQARGQRVEEQGAAAVGPQPKGRARAGRMRAGDRPGWQLAAPEDHIAQVGEVPGVRRISAGGGLAVEPPDGVRLDLPGAVLRPLVLPVMLTGCA